MIQQKLRKVGNSYAVTIPKEEVQRRNLREGQLVWVEVSPLEVRPSLDPEIRRLVLETWEEDEAAYRYLGR